MKKVALFSVILAVLLVVAGVAMAQESGNETTTAAAPEVSTPVAASEAPAAPVNVGNKVCPVSGMTIADAEMGTNTAEYEGKVYNLCSAGCKDEFVKDPKKYVAKVDEQMAKEKEAAAPKM